MLFIFSTCASGAHDRATWYILYKALCPVAGSAGFSASFFFSVGVVSEHPLSNRTSVAAIDKESFRIGICATLYQRAAGGC
jgi:hypothetical protein